MNTNAEADICGICHDSGIVLKSRWEGIEGEYRWGEFCTCIIGEAHLVQTQETIRDIAAGRVTSRPWSEIKAELGL